MGEKLTPSQVNYARSALEDWASWELIHIQQSAIGFPSTTVECRMMRGEIGGNIPAHSICPNVLASARVNWVDQVVKALPWQARAAIRWKYEEPGIRTEGERMREWAQHTGYRSTGYYDALNSVYRTIAG